MEVALEPPCPAVAQPGGVHPRVIRKDFPALRGQGHIQSGLTSIPVVVTSSPHLQPQPRAAVSADSAKGGWEGRAGLEGIACK